MAIQRNREGDNKNRVESALIYISSTKTDVAYSTNLLIGDMSFRKMYKNFEI